MPGNDSPPETPDLDDLVVEYTTGHRERLVDVLQDRRRFDLAVERIRHNPDMQAVVTVPRQDGQGTFTVNISTYPKALPTVQLPYLWGLNPGGLEDLPLHLPLLPMAVKPCFPFGRRNLI